MSTSSLPDHDRPNVARALLLHVVVPMFAPLALVGLYFTPVALIGCVNRGLLAVGVAVVAGIAAVFCGFRASPAGRRGDESTGLWLTSAVLLLIPLLLLIWPLG